MSQPTPNHELQALRRGYERASERGWGLALGLLAAGGLFLATAILVVRGGPNPGPHLGLLGVYLPYYTVTWAGAFVGAGYALVFGYAAGRLIGTIYNAIVGRQRLP